MADRAWSWSTCRAGVQWYGVPGQGCWYNYNGKTIWVGGAVHQWYSWQGYECGNLGPPVKPYGPISEFGGGEGVWFQGGCIIYKYTTANWGTYYGNFGQNGLGPIDESQFTEVAGGPDGDWSVLEPMPEPPDAPEPPVHSKAD